MTGSWNDDHVGVSIGAVILLTVLGDVYVMIFLSCGPVDCWIRYPVGDGTCGLQFRSCSIVYDCGMYAAVDYHSG